MAGKMAPKPSTPLSRGLMKSSAAWRARALLRFGNESLSRGSLESLQDPVIDVTLAVILLDLTVHPADTLSGVPLNPPANDVPFGSDFPYLAPAH